MRRRPLASPGPTSDSRRFHARHPAAPKRALNSWALTLWGRRSFDAVGDLANPDRVVGYLLMSVDVVVTPDHADQGDVEASARRGESARLDRPEIAVAADVNAATVGRPHTPFDL